MRVLVLAPLPPPISGHSLVSKDLVDYLGSCHEISVLDLGIDSTSDGSVSLRRIWRVFALLWGVSRRAKSADVVYLTISESVAGNLKDLLIFMLCGRRLGSVVTHLHGGTIRTAIFDRYPLLRWANRAVLSRIGGMIVCGPSHRAAFDGLVPGHRIHEVPNYSREDYFLSPSEVRAKFLRTGPTRVLYLSSMTVDKGWREVLDAYASLPREARARMTVDFAGGFRDPDHERTFLRTLEEVPGVRYHGVVDGEVKKALLRDAHLFMLPSSLQEGQPVSILEAYASGCVVAATLSGGIGDIFRPGENGVLIESRSKTGVIRAMEAVLGMSPGAQLATALRNRRLAGDAYRTDLFFSKMDFILREVAK